jgi:hypothetical protein
MITEDTINKLIDLFNKEADILSPLIEKSVELGDEEDYEDTISRLQQSGYVDGLETAINLLREDLVRDAELV